MLEITLFLFNILLIVVIVVVYVKLTFLVKNQGLQIQLLLKHDKEGFRVKEGMAPAQRWANAAKYVGMENGLLPSDKQSQLKTKYVQSLTSERGDRRFDYLLPGANIAGQTPAESNEPSVGGEVVEQPNAAPVESTSIADQPINSEEAAKASANAMADVGFKDTAQPDTSGMPVEDQRGVNEGGKEPYYCGSNTRVCPSFMENGKFTIANKYQKDGNSSSKEGFRPRPRYNA